MTSKKIKANPTQARDVALYFLDLTSDRITPQIVARTVKQVKDVMENGYTKEELIKVIDYILDRKSGIYSFGYISASINDVLRKIYEEEDKQVRLLQSVALHSQLTSTIESQREEVGVIDESTDRNRDKARGIGVQSRFGKKFDFDMLKGE